jgi:ribosomal protein S18 acetylase RimI-like enzyme
VARRLTDIVLLDHRLQAVAEQIVDVEQAGYQVEARLTGYDGMPGLHQDAAAVMALDLQVLGAMDDDRLVGLLGYIRHGALVDVDRLAVHPDQFRRGIGTALLGDLHRREADAPRIEVMTSTGNTPAISLYLQAGYVIVGRDDGGPVPVSHFARSRENGDGSVS